MTQAQAPVVVGEQLIATRRRRRFKSNPLIHISLFILMAIWALPAIGLLVSSFREARDISRSGWWTALYTPSNFTLDNYQAVLGRSGLTESFINSFVITVPATVIVVMIAAFAAYAFAWMNFPGRDWLFVLLVGLLVIPLQVTLVPVLRLFGTFTDVTGVPIHGTFLALWLAHTGYGLPFAIYLLRNYFGGLPKEVFESAAIDGASPVTAFFRLALPMSVPVLASLIIFQFLWVWNDLLVALVYLGVSPDLFPLSVVLANLTTSRGGDWQFLTAAAFVSMVVPIVIFLSLQRYFVRGITGGAVKG
ncbi:MAG TPA: carbohydrate ABC transporter permease [Candidatus Limnocylindrales bacterium]|nr:carbohydrate ABC transporter permease [Candidatus Limnocylindrales bacterium]